MTDERPIAGPWATIQGGVPDPEPTSGPPTHDRRGRPLRNYGHKPAKVAAPTPKAAAAVPKSDAHQLAGAEPCPHCRYAGWDPIAQRPYCDCSHYGKRTPSPDPEWWSDRELFERVMANERAESEEYRRVQESLCRDGNYRWTDGLTSWWHIAGLVALFFIVLNLLRAEF